MSTDQPHSNSKTISLSDTQLGKAVVDAKFATKAELEACIAKREKLKVGSPGTELEFAL